MCRLRHIQSAQPFNVRSNEHSNTTRLTLSAVEEHLRDTAHELEGGKVAVIATVENHFKEKICEALEILCQPQMLNRARDCGFELPALYRDVLTQVTS